jgi:trans-aconitate methyltransferase
MTSTPPAFDSHASDYETQCAQGLSVSGESKDFFARGRVAYLRSLWERRGLPEPERVVDFGCGVGDVTPILAEHFPRARILGLDPSSGCVERARSAFAGERIAFATLAEAPAGFRAQVVHLNGVIHHVPPAAREAVFTSLASLVEPGGLVALFDNNPLNPGTRIVMSRIPFDRDASTVTSWRVAAHLRAAGLVPLETAYLFYFPRLLSPLRFLEPLLTRLPLGAQYGVFAQKRI